MIPMVMALVQAGTTAAQAGMGILGGVMQNAAFRRQTRMRVEQLTSNAAIVGQRTGFEQARISDAVEATQARQANYWASGNVDASSGTPAILAAQSEAMGMQDMMLAAARGQQERADIYGQIASAWSKADDMQNSTFLNGVSTVLGAAGKMAGIASGQAQQAGGWGNLFSTGGSIPPSSGQPMNIRPPASWSL